MKKAILIGFVFHIPLILWAISFLIYGFAVSETVYVEGDKLAVNLYMVVPLALPGIYFIGKIKNRTGLGILLVMSFMVITIIFDKYAWMFISGIISLMLGQIGVGIAKWVYRKDNTTYMVMDGDK